MREIEEIGKKDQSKLIPEQIEKYSKKDQIAKEIETLEEDLAAVL